jgi:hypothetical protein
MTIQAGYTLSADFLFSPNFPVKHRCDEYDETGFKAILDLQHRHFWYRGRHRFLLAEVGRFLPKAVNKNNVIYLGGGVGGWVRYLAEHRPNGLGQIVLEVSSLERLKLAEPILPLKSPELSDWPYATSHD